MDRASIEQTWMVRTNMKVFVTKRYYKRSVRGREPIKYKARQPHGIGKDIHVTIRMDPVLKKHPDLRKALLRHEISEIRAWGKGKTGTHKKAREKEPKLLRKIGGVMGFWREIKRREKR